MPGWTPQGEARSFVADNLFEYMDGNAEGYLLYGFQNMHGVTCVKDGVTLVIDISDFGDADSAYGMFCANRDLRQPAGETRHGRPDCAAARDLRQGPVLRGDRRRTRGRSHAALQAWTAALEKIAPGSIDVPVALSWFPPREQQSLRLVPESVLGIRLLKRGYVAQYDFGKAFVVTEGFGGIGRRRDAEAARAFRRDGQSDRRPTMPSR